MNTDYKLGLKTGFLVYLIGIPLVIFTHLILGFNSGHLPPTSFVAALALFILAIIRLVTNASRIFMGKSANRNKGELLIHFIFLALVLSYILFVYVSSSFV